MFVHVSVCEVNAFIFQHGFKGVCGVYEHPHKVTEHLCDCQCKSHGFSMHVCDMQVIVELLWVAQMQ